MESVQKLTHVEHVLKRPDSYVGPVDKTHESYWLLNNTNKNFQKKNISYSPALLKIFDEILVNAIDRNSLHPKNVTQISVSVDKETGASWTLTSTRFLRSVCGMQTSAQPLTARSSSKVKLFQRLPLKRMPKCMKVSQMCVQ
jgi:hypothetical protein